MQDNMRWVLWMEHHIETRCVSFHPEAMQALPLHHSAPIRVLFLLYGILAHLWWTRTHETKIQSHLLCHPYAIQWRLSQKLSDYLLICIHHEQTVCCWVNAHGGDSRTVYRNCAMSLKRMRSLLTIHLLSNDSIRLYKHCGHITHLPRLQVVDVNLVVTVSRGQPFAILTGS